MVLEAARPSPQASRPLRGPFSRETLEPPRRSSCAPSTSQGPSAWRTTSCARCEPVCGTLLTRRTRSEVRSIPGDAKARSDAQRALPGTSQVSSGASPATSRRRWLIVPSVAQSAGGWNLWPSRQSDHRAVARFVSLPRAGGLHQRCSRVADGGGVTVSRRTRLGRAPVRAVGESRRLDAVGQRSGLGHRREDLELRARFLGVRDDRGSSKCRPRTASSRRTSLRIFRSINPTCVRPRSLANLTASTARRWSRGLRQAV
jgi:hypothetical protein